MHLAFYTIALAAVMTSASAATPSPLSTPSLAPEAVATLTHPAPRKTSAPAQVVALQTVALTPAPNQAVKASQEDSEWQAFGMLAATLALIATIAVRRHKAGKS